MRFCILHETLGSLDWCATKMQVCTTGIFRHWRRNTSLADRSMDRCTVKLALREISMFEGLCRIVDRVALRYYYISDIGQYWILYFGPHWDLEYINRKKSESDPWKKPSEIARVEFITSLTLDLLSWLLVVDFRFLFFLCISVYTYVFCSMYI